MRLRLHTGQRETGGSSRLMRCWGCAPDQALEEALAPRLRLAGDTGSLAKFGGFMSERTLEKGAGVVLLYRVEGALEVALLPLGDEDYASVRSVAVSLRVWVVIQGFWCESTHPFARYPGADDS